MIKYYRLDDDKNVVETSMHSWAMQYENLEDTRRVGLDSHDGYTVSTVFLGIDHNWSDKGPPILFETMSFPDEVQERYSTWKDALAGHYRHCERVWGKNWRKKVRDE